MRLTSRPLTKRKKAILHILFKKYPSPLLWDIKKPIFGLAAEDGSFREHPLVVLTQATQESLDRYLRKLDP